MKKYLILCAMISSFMNGLFGDEREVMTGEALEAVILKVAGEGARVNRNIIEFDLEGVILICIYDESHNRMRIVSPIKKYEDVSSFERDQMMAANFHAALDARYCETSGILYSAYIHPLSPLEEFDVITAIYQVLSLNKSFGTEYTSGLLTFGGGEEPIEPI